MVEQAPFTPTPEYAAMVLASVERMLVTQDEVPIYAGMLVFDSDTGMAFRISEFTQKTTGAHRVCGWPIRRDGGIGGASRKVELKNLYAIEENMHAARRAMLVTD